MTCKEAVHALERAKLAGQRCYGETCPQYLLLDDSVFDKPDFGGSAYVMSPPIRPAGAGHHDSLWHGLANRMLDSVGTDHCPFTHEQKLAGKDDFTRIPNGAAGIEDRLLLLYTHGVLGGRFDLSRMVELGSTAPARIFGLPKKGSVAVGMDADLVLLDPARAAPSPLARTIRGRTAASTKASRCAAASAHDRLRSYGLGWRRAHDDARGAGRFIARQAAHFSPRSGVRP
jgi:dihydropyrimidinase